MCHFLIRPSFAYTVRINFPGESQYWLRYMWSECQSSFYSSFIVFSSPRKLLEEFIMQTHNTKKLLVRNKWPQWNALLMNSEFLCIFLKWKQEGCINALTLQFLHKFLFSFHCSRFETSVCLVFKSVFWLNWVQASLRQFCLGVTARKKGSLFTSHKNTYSKIYFFDSNRLLLWVKLHPSKSMLTS